MISLLRSQLVTFFLLSKYGLSETSFFQDSAFWYVICLCVDYSFLYSCRYVWSGALVIAGIYLSLYSKNRASWNAKIRQLFEKLRGKPKNLPQKISYVWYFNFSPFFPSSRHVVRLHRSFRQIESVFFLYSESTKVHVPFIWTIWLCLQLNHYILKIFEQENFDTVLSSKEYTGLLSSSFIE